MNVNELAVKVADKAKTNKEVAAVFDPTWIVVIAEALVPLIQAVMDCIASFGDTPEGVVQKAKNPRLIHKIMVRNNLRKTLGLRFMSKYGDALVSSVIASGAELTPDDVVALCDEVKNAD